MEQKRESPPVERLQGAITIDLEDWRTALYSGKHTQTHNDDKINHSYIRDSTRKLLEELENADTKATFFILGEVALTNPDVVVEISRKGHEIASHSPTHIPTWAIPRDRRIPMIKRDVDLFEELTGKKPLGFRAPYFSMRRQDGWLLEALSDLGFKYDSSIIPTWTPLYGMPSAPKIPYFPAISDLSKAESSGQVIELPITVWPSWRSLPGVPVGGGFFLRMWPIKATMFALRRNLRTKTPLVLYLHPGDLDSEKEKIEGMPAIDRVIQRFGAERGRSHFRTILRELRLGPISEVFSSLFQDL